MYQKLKPYRLGIIFLLTVIVRLGVLFAFPSVFAWDKTGTVHGSDAYDKLAMNLLNTGVYGFTPGVPDATIPPLYAYLVALVYQVFGRAYLPIALLHIGLDVISILCLYQIGRRLLPNGENAALLACLATAFYPYLIFQNLTLIDTPLFMTLLTAFVLALVMIREKPHVAWILFGGVVLGLAMLSRPIIAPLGLLGALWFLFRLNLRQTLIRLAPVAVIGALVTVPWIIRNYTVYNAFVPIANNGGLNFWFGNSRFTIPFLRAGYHTQWATPDFPIAPDSHVSNGQFMQDSLAFLKANPSKIPELLWVKFLAHWSIDVYPGKNPVAGTVLVLDSSGNVSAQLNSLNSGDPVVAYSQPLFDQIGRVIHIVYFGGLLLLAVVGVIVTRQQWREVSLLWFVQISMTVMYVLFIPATRYRVPSDPLLFLFSGSGLLWAYGQISAYLRRRQRSV